MADDRNVQTAEADDEDMSDQDDFDSDDWGSSDGVLMTLEGRPRGCRQAA
jgi:hypothetical protein